MNTSFLLKPRLPLPLALCLFLAMSSNSHGDPTSPSAQFARVNLSGSVSEIPLPIYAQLRDASGQDYVWVKATEDELRASGLTAQIIIDADVSGPLYLARSRLPADRSLLPASLRILHDDGNNLLLAPGGPADRAALSSLGYELRRLPSSPLIFMTTQPAAFRADPPPLSSNAFVADMIARVEMTNLHASLSELTGVVPVMADGVFSNLATRNTYETNALNRALAYAQNRLQALGLTVSQQDWSAYDSWEGRNVASRNLIAERTGTTAPNEIVILCAHVDSLPESPHPAPGADDNASGSVGVLAAARAMRDFEFERTIRFVLFTGEEQGCLGSIAYASNALAAGDNIVGVLNLDMISYDGNDDGHLNLTARLPSHPGHAADMELVAAFTNAVSSYGLSGQLSPLVYDNGTGYSDHEPFWNVGIPAILAIEDWENGDITPHYHQSTDTIETLNLPFFEAFTKACVGAAAHLAVPVGPVWMPGTSTNVVLSDTETNRLYFTATQNMYYGVHVSNATSNVQFSLSPITDPFTTFVFTNALGWVCPSSGTYRLNVTGAADTSAALRLYTLTNTIARISALATNLMETYGLVGAGFSLVDGNHVVCQTGFGHADLERGIPADENTVFMIGSCSKTFGAIAAMQFAEEGLLDLDAPLTNALPSFSIHQRFSNSVITPRSILTHHSGLPGDLFNRGFTVSPLPNVPDAVQAMLADEYTLMPTNTMWAYNNSGFVMLGQLFRHISGQELDVFARERLFDRMGMTNSSIAYDLPYIREHLARPYIGGTVQPNEYINLFFAGAIYSTASDMSRYMRMLLAGGQGDHARVVSNETLRAMTLKQNSDVPLDQYVSLLNQGIGFLLDPISLQYMGKVIWHDGGTVYFRTLMRVATDAQLGCFISCNSYEGAALNYALVDAALQWAYEEKTGTAPPDPVAPETPAVAVAPPEVIALATGGAYVTSDGYDRFRHDGTNLLARFNAQLDEAAERVWTYRENGWFTPTNAYEPQLVFTQAAGRVISVLKTYEAITNLTLLGERSADIADFHPAWSNRLGRWWATNIHPDDTCWHGDDLRLAWPMLRLDERDGMLLAQTENLYVMSATNDALAFAAGLGRNKGSSLRAPDADTLAFMGVTYRSEAGIPLLNPGTFTNGVITGDETHWLRIPAATSPLTLDLATDHDLTAYLYTENDGYLGQANRAHAFHLDATNAQPLVVAIVRNGTNVGPWTLFLHTNAIPFARQLAQADWPDYLLTHTNLYGDLEFGHVFVRENRSPPSDNLLKLAFVRMISTNVSAKPYFFCHGGPGTSSIRSTIAKYLRNFTTTHDVYLLDQRGIHYSQPDLGARTSESMGDVQYRVAHLQDADLSTLNTLESSHDLDDIAHSLSLSNVTLHGHSYGSLLAQTLMRRNPAWLEAVILDGVVAPNIPFLADGGPVRYNAYRALFSDIAAHPTASVYYPGFENTLFTLADNLASNPAVIQIDGASVTVDGAFFLQMVEGQMGISDLGDRERIPCIVWRASRGETQALAELAQYHIPLDNAASGLMSLLVNNHDFIPFFSLDEARRQCEELPDILRQSQMQSVEQILAQSALLEPCGQADNAFTNPVVSPIPTLVINGTYDRATGTNWAAEVARHLPNAQLVIAPTIGHGVLYATNGCTLQVMRDFLASPTNAPDTSCVSNLVLDFPAPWPANAALLAAGSSLSGAVTNPGVASWHELAPPVPAAPVGGIANVQCQLRIVNMPDPFLARIYGVDNGSLIAQQRGPGTLGFSSDGTPFVLAIQPGNSGEQTGEYEIEFTVPLLVRKLEMAPPNVHLVWQGPTGAVLSVETAPYLAEFDTFVPVVENLASTNLLQQEFIPLGPDTTRLFRVAIP